MAADNRLPAESVSWKPDDRRDPQPIRIGVIYRRALATYWARFPIVAGAAVVVFVPLALLMTAITIWGARYKDDHPGEAGLLVFLATLVGTSVILFGSAFYAGLLDRVVGEHQDGHHREPVLDVMRTLPYKRLLSAEILLSIVVTAGMMLFVVPGLLLFTLFSLVGPLITIEHRTAIGGFRRSLHLIRPVVLGAFVGLVEVTLAFALIQREADTMPDQHRNNRSAG